MQWLRHAFPVDPPGPAELSADEKALVDQFADFIVRRGLAAPALLFLDASAPLNYVASQLLVFFGPFGRRIFNRHQYEQLRQLLERRGSVEALARGIEARLNDADQADPQPPEETSL
jgi:hypothetical protein